MVKCVFWVNPFVSLGKAIIAAPKVCLNIGAGMFCGAVQAIGVEIFTKGSVNQALDLKQAAEACRDELPVKLTSEHDQIAEIMTEASKDSVVKAKAVLAGVGIDQKCIAIFGLVCSKAAQFNALDIIKEACANLWV